MSNLGESTIPMDPKDRIEALRHYSQSHRSQFNERTKYEYKVILSVLAFYVLSVAAIQRGEANLPSDWISVAGIWVLFVGLAGFTAYFLKGIQIAQAKNKTLAEWAENNVAKLVSGETDCDPAPTKEDLKKLENDKSLWLGNWAWLPQVLVIGAFSVTAAFLITFRTVCTTD